MNLGAVFFCCQFDMQFSYATTHLAHPVLCRPTHINISVYASASVSYNPLKKKNYNMLI